MDRDPVAWVAGALRAALVDWPGLWVSNDRDGHTPAVTVVRAGGPVGLVTDDARLLVNVYASTPVQLSKLAYTVRGSLVDLARVGGIKTVRVSGPSEISTESTEPDQALLSVDVRVRRLPRL